MAMIAACAGILFLFGGFAPMAEAQNECPTTTTEAPSSTTSTSTTSTSTSTTSTTAPSETTTTECPTTTTSGGSTATTSSGSGRGSATTAAAGTGVQATVPNAVKGQGVALTGANIAELTALGVFLVMVGIYVLAFAQAKPAQK